MTDGDQELERLFGLSSLVSLVVAPEDFERVGIANNSLYGRRSDINSNGDFFVGLHGSGGLVTDTSV